MAPATSTWDVDKHQRSFAFVPHPSEISAVSRWHVAEGPVALKMERLELSEWRFCGYIFPRVAVDPGHLPAVPEHLMVSDPFNWDLEERSTEAGSSAGLRSLRVKAQFAPGGEETVRMQRCAVNGAVEAQPLTIDSCSENPLPAEILATLQLVGGRLDQRWFAQRVDQLAKHRIRYGVDKRWHETRVIQATGQA
jgi:hypothetical protein